MTERYSHLLGSLDSQEVGEASARSGEGSSSRRQESSTSDAQDERHMPRPHVRNNGFRVLKKRAPTDARLDTFSPTGSARLIPRAPQASSGTLSGDFSSSASSDQTFAISPSFTATSQTTIPLFPATMIIFGSTTTNTGTTTTDTRSTTSTSTVTTTTDTALGFTSSPPPTPTTDPPTISSQPFLPGEQTPVGAIVGGVLGGLAMICITIIIALYFFTRARSRRHSTSPSPFGFGFHSHGPESPSTTRPLEPITQWLTAPSKESLLNDSRVAGTASTNATVPRQRYYDTKTSNHASSTQDVQSTFISGRPTTVYSSLSVPGTLPEYCNPAVRDSEPPPFYRDTANMPKLRDPPLQNPFVSPSL